MKFKQSEITKKRISLARKGKKMSLKHKEIMRKKAIENNPMKNKEVVRKVSNALKGRKFSEEHKKNLSESHKKHKIGIKARENIGRARKIFWERHPEKKKNLGKRMKDGKKIEFNHSEESKEKMRKSWNNEFKKQKAIEKLRKLRIEGKLITPIKDSSIEIKVQKLLSELHLDFLTHKYMKIKEGYQCDIYIPVQNGVQVKTIIECDGCYWHHCPICKLKKHKNKEMQETKDRLRTLQLEEKGFRVIRLWEHEIKDLKLNELKEKL